MPAERPAGHAAFLGVLALLAATFGRADDADLPDEAFLEFLGTWEDAQGNWLDPLELEAVARRVPEPTERETRDDAADALDADEPVPEDDGLASDTSSVGAAAETLDDEATTPDERTDDDSAT